MYGASPVAVRGLELAIAAISGIAHTSGDEITVFAAGTYGVCSGWNWAEDQEAYVVDRRCSSEQRLDGRRSWDENTACYRSGYEVTIHRDRCSCGEGASWRRERKEGFPRRRWAAMTLLGV